MRHLVSLTPISIRARCWPSEWQGDQPLLKGVGGQYLAFKTTRYLLLTDLRTHRSLLNFKALRWRGHYTRFQPNLDFFRRTGNQICHEGRKGLTSTDFFSTSTLVQLPVVQHLLLDDGVAQKANASKQPMIFSCGAAGLLPVSASLRPGIYSGFAEIGPAEESRHSSTAARGTLRPACLLFSHTPIPRSWCGHPARLL